MVVKVLIADDEHLVRFGLRSMFEEMKLPIEVCGEAVNGTELLRQLEIHKPDLVFVDIRMPGLGGLEAVRRAREKGIISRWVVLSSYPEFSYASESIKLGASAYLLKPVDIGTLRDSVVSILEELKRERLRQSQDFENALVIAQRDRSRRSPRPAVSCAWFCLLVLDPDYEVARSFVDQTRQTIEEKVRSLLHESLPADLSVAVLKMDESSLAVVVRFAQEDAQAHRAAGTFRERFKDEVRSRFGNPVRPTGFWSSELRSFESLLTSLDESKTFLAFRALFGTGTFHSLPSLQSRQSSLGSGDRDLANIAVEFVEAFRRGNPRLLSEKGGELQSFSENFSPILLDFLRFQTGWDPAVEGISDFAEHLRGEVRRRGDAHVRVIERVETYLEKEYASNLRVPEIASRLGLTPNYLSTIFHKIAGRTILDRLTEVRLEKARILLRRPGSQVKEVASAVGYHSPRHFSQLFKEKYGRPPSSV